MKKIHKFAQYLTDRIFSRLEAPRRNYEKTMINNMDNLQRVIRKGDIILVEGNSEISRMIKLLTQSSWSHSAIYAGDELVRKGNIRGESLIQQFGKAEISITKNYGPKRFSKPGPQKLNRKRIERIRIENLYRHNIRIDNDRKTQSASANGFQK